jgi:enoyl-CoA hydratase/carnithine racemase
LAASCDLLVAASSALFSTPGVKFGVFCSTPGVAVARNISNKLALRMLFTGETINATQAFSYGLLSELVDQPEHLEARVNEIVKQIAANSAPIVALGKRSFYEQMNCGGNLNNAYRVATEAMLENLKYEDTQNGLNAFATKKKPIWTHSNKKSY